MKQHKEFFITNFFEKSKIALNDSKKAIENDSLLTAHNRIYYAVFYSVISLGYSKNFITSKHGKLMGWFNKYFVHENKIFDKQLFKIYENAFQNRMESDYSFTTELDKNEVLSNFNDAVFFIETVEKYLKTLDYD